MKLLQLFFYALIAIVTNVNADNDVTDIKHNTSFKEYSFENSKFYYKGESIYIDGLTSEMGPIAISESPNKKYTVLMTRNDNDSKAFLINLKEHIATELPLNGPPLLWVSWSPKSNFLIMGSYYEADMKLYSIGMPAGFTKLIEPKINLKTDKENRDLEQLDYDLDNSKWISGNSFQVQALVVCNPYGDNECEKSKNRKILKSYTLVINSENQSVMQKRTD